ncbi:WASH complex subunit 4 [Agrilus planipennis]|uniref:WASH complex subunit 4 n=1 Tax=Agrilus planipennis TaxID=224129 RepID=A0A1W4WXN1_AGRPL|nr:WASH complex subunit 4 [Agrilus planipennis]
MLEPRELIERKITKEAEERAAKEQLHQYGIFLNNYQSRLNTFIQSLPYNNLLCKPIIYVEAKPFEDLDIVNIVYSDNKLLSRILASLGSLCEEASFLSKQARTHFYVTLTYYRDDNVKHIEVIDTSNNLIEVLQKLYFFVLRCNNVIGLILRQLCALLGKNLYKGASSTCFFEPLSSLGDLLVCLVTLDNMLNTPNIKSAWLFYCKIVKSGLHNPKKFDVTLDSLRGLDESLGRIEVKLLRGTVFQQAIEKCVEEDYLVSLKNSNISNELFLYINQLLIELEKDDTSIFYIPNWIKLNIMFVFHYKLFGTLDKKLYKRLAEVNRKNVACTLYGTVMIYPDKFLVEHIPNLGRNTDEKILTNNKGNRITLIDQNFYKDSSNLFVESCLWIIDIREVLKKDMYSFKEKDLQEICSLIVLGLKLLVKNSKLSKWILNLHEEEGKPITKSTLFSLFKLIEVMKAMQFTFQKNCLPLAYTTCLVAQHLTHIARSKLTIIKKSFVREKSYKEQQLDIISSLNVAENALKGPNTHQRILVAKLALSASGIPSGMLSELRSVINCIEVISGINDLLESSFDGSFMHWQSTLLPVFLSKVISTKADISRIYLLLDAFEDHRTLIKDKNCSTINNLIQRYLVDPLNQLIETNLRIQTHMHLNPVSISPFKNLPPTSLKNYIPTKFFNEFFNVKQDIEHYLSTTFYNLTTVVLHDWKTYGEMRRLAQLQYSLETVEDGLPMQTLEQGLDVLEIMRNIDIFVSKYMYNLNNQVFIEEWSNNKYLNTIGISHVANSIRSHGIGIMNTTVNFIYQFLQKKFYIFSQFMFDEQIKSRLLKDIKYFTDHKEELRQMYPYERAEKFNTGIRRLGVNEEGYSYLDLFRKLITQIGNAMGYVRMIRSGGRRCLADATCFIPNLKEAETIPEMLNESLPEQVKAASLGFQRDLKNLIENFEEATEYFQLLINVFAPVFRESQNMHLKNFYVIIPPLTINFIQHIVACKERLSKKNKTGAAFTDDGFAMGLAYIIELLDQTSNLNSLHWFQSINTKITEQRKALEKQKCKEHKDDEKLQQTLSLTEKRLDTFDKEFQLLYFNFNSAKIFFKT